MRTARVLLVSLHNPADSNDDAGRRVEGNLQNVLALLEKAEAYDPDVVCFPETTLHHAVRRYASIEEVAQRIPGPATEAVGEKARKLDAYVLFGLFERDGDRLYNAAPLVGRDGDVVGTYRKLAPTIGEMDQGVVPGTDVPVWDTEFGRLGAAICWDAQYAEVGSHLSRKGAALVLRPTLGSEHSQLSTWALFNSYHVANCDKNSARFYAPTGDDFAGNFDGWNMPEVDDVDLHGGTAHFSFAELNTDFRTYPSRGWIQDALREYRGSLVFHESVEDGLVALESIDSDVTLDDIEQEFGGETMRSYRERTRDRALAENENSPLLRPVSRE